jgi:hypothetical protein
VSSRSCAGSSAIVVAFFRDSAMEVTLPIRGGRRHSIVEESMAIARVTQYQTIALQIPAAHLQKVHVELFC